MSCVNNVLRTIAFSKSGRFISEWQACLMREWQAMRERWRRWVISGKWDQSAA